VLTKYGNDVLWKFFAIELVAIICTVFFVPEGPVKDGIYLLLAVVAAFVLNFFRNPKRTPPQGNDIVISPADGKVVEIKEYFEDEYLHADAVQVSIFMSPLDVHVNRFPVSGTIEHFCEIQGGFGPAFEHKSSERNYRTHIGVVHDGQKVLFKQISGAIARRIVAEISIGQTAVAGAEFGMIKFGSRMDVILAKNSEILVRLGERVIAGESILAKLKY